MAAGILVLIQLLGGLACLICIFSAIGDGEKGIAKFFGWVLSILIIGPAIWMYIAWDQDLMPNEYHYVEALQYPSGKIVYKVYPSGVDAGCTVECDGPLPNDTIVKVWRRYPWKNGLNWCNSRPNLEVVPPTYSWYNEVKEKAQRKGIKVIDIKIVEQ